MVSRSTAMASVLKLHLHLDRNDYLARGPSSVTGEPIRAPLETSAHQRKAIASSIWSAPTLVAQVHPRSPRAWRRWRGPCRVQAYADSERSQCEHVIVGQARDVGLSGQHRLVVETHSKGQTGLLLQRGPTCSANPRRWAASTRCPWWPGPLSLGR